MNSCFAALATPLSCKMPEKRPRQSNPPVGARVSRRFRSFFARIRNKLKHRILEDELQHEFTFVADHSKRPRLTFVIPHVLPEKAFGGMTTALDIYLELGKRTGAELRIVIDELHGGEDKSVIEKCARTAGVEFQSIEIIQRAEPRPALAVRAGDVFMTFNCWTTLNIRGLLRAQAEAFQMKPNPFLYPIQEYEPHFYPFSSTHMLARHAFDSPLPCWGIFNSIELFDYFVAQGHRVDRAFVFEPQLSKSLRPYLQGDEPEKAKRILVYGRPTVERNCFPAVQKGLQMWAAKYPEFSDWEVISAGMQHRPLNYALGRYMRSVGKLSLEDYAELLRTTAAGLSLMASPHPSYPPLEMAHFGLLTITNKYANKNLTSSHQNIYSVDDIQPATIADGLAEICRRFEQAPQAGWHGQSTRPSFLNEGPFPFLDELAEALERDVWGSRKEISNS